jgi:flagellar biosynthesis/type III secretory pathway ATPase
MRGALLGAYDRAEMMIQAGLYVAGSDPAVDRAIRLWPGWMPFWPKGGLLAG